MWVLLDYNNFDSNIFSRQIHVNYWSVFYFAKLETISKVLNFIILIVSYYSCLKCFLCHVIFFFSDCIFLFHGLVLQFLMFLSLKFHVFNVLHSFLSLYYISSWFYYQVISKLAAHVLTILTGTNCFIQFSKRMAGWLLLTFSYVYMFN